MTEFERVFSQNNEDAKEYEFVTLNGTQKASFDGETILLPAFEGMLCLVAGKL